MNSSDPDAARPGGLDRLREHERLRPSADAAFRLDRYDILEILGEGASAVVYRARDRQLGRSVALKVLRGPLAAVADARERFHREARLMASLSHPNLVAIHDEGEVDGRGYLVMELVEGEPLAFLMRRGDASRASLVALLEKTARGVAAAHERGIIHRDLKPTNILVTREGRPKVADFGLARTEGGGDLTRTGSILGTPLYMSPEQVSGRPEAIGPRTDVYALGAILYEILAGRPPHVSDSVGELYRKILMEDPAPPSSTGVGVPGDLALIAMKALEKDPARRYAGATELADDLARHLAGEPIRTRPPGPVDIAGKWLRRHRSAAAAIPFVLASVALLSFLALRDAAARRATLRDQEALRIFEGARESLERADAYLRSEGAEAAELRKRLVPARELIARGLAAAPHLPLGHLLAGRVAELTGDFARAEKDYRHAVSLDGRFGAARDRLGRLLWTRAFLSYSRGLEATHRLAVEAANEIDRAIALPGAFDGDLRRTVADAMLLYARDDFARLRDLARAGIDRHRDVDGVEELWLLLGLGSPADEALTAYDEAIRRHPGFAVARLSRGVLRLDEGDPGKAADDFSAALRVMPDLPELWVNRGESRRAQGRPDLAITDFDEAIRLAPADPRPRASRAAANLDLRALDAARADVDEALRLDPRHAFAYNVRGMLKGAAGDRPGEAEDYSRSIELNPRAPEPRVNRGILRGEQGDFAGAAKDLEEALKVAPPKWPQRTRIEQLLAEARRR